MNIDDYIELSKNMPNTSDGGSAAYHFKDVVLVKYIQYNKYGLARDKEEFVRKEANEKRKNGINTPYHYAIKRQIVDDKNICWVLQERAKGVCFDHFETYHHTGEQQLKLQQELINLPDKIYDKCVLDISSLLYMGIELKPKNVYFDYDYGFTFIDLLESSTKKFDDQSLKDLVSLDLNMHFISGFSTLYDERKNVSKEDIEKSQELSYQIQLNAFQAMERVVPHFKDNRRWILRTYSNKKLKYFNKHIPIDDLTLDNREQQLFDQYIDQIISKCLIDLELGKVKLWQIEANEIRNMLLNLGLNYSYNYHPNKEIDAIDYKDYWEYESALNKCLEQKVIQKFYDKLLLIDSNNPNIQEALDELEQRKKGVRL